MSSPLRRQLVRGRSKLDLYKIRRVRSIPASQPGSPSNYVLSNIFPEQSCGN